MDEWEGQGIRWSFQELLSRCAALPAPAALIDVDDPQLMLPGHTIDKINAQLKALGQPAFGFGARFDCFACQHDLSQHGRALRGSAGLDRQDHRERNFARLFIVGGGSQNTLLNQLTAQRTGLEIILGSAESSTIGNFAVQMAALEHDGNRPDGRYSEFGREMGRADVRDCAYGVDDRETN